MRFLVKNVKALPMGVSKSNRFRVVPRLIFFSINDLSGSLGAAIEPLGAGTFFMETVDANNCRDTFGFVVPAGLPFDFELGIDSATIFSGDTFRLDLQLSATVDSVFWTPAATKSSFFSTDFAPNSTTTFVATAINSLGCKAADEFTLFVKTKRDFYSPNIIQRSASLRMKTVYFTIYTSGGVTEIELLEVFDRWGNLVFQKKNFPAGLPEVRVGAGILTEKRRRWAYLLFALSFDRPTECPNCIWANF